MSPISPRSSPSVSTSRQAATKWPASVSAQRPYGSGSCGGSAAKLMTKRSVGGIVARSICAPLRSFSERAPPGQHRRDRLEQDREVEQDRPLLQVEEVE